MKRKIRIENLSYQVLSQQILRDIRLRVESKQFVGLIGPNGSGKTTLLRHIYRALPTDKRTIFINDHALEEFSYRATARQVTVMRQENATDFDYTILEMVLMGRSPHRKFYERDSAQDRQIAKQALHHVEMSRFAERSFATLSGGEKQRVLIARSLAQQADILVLDEPTNHLDVYYQWSLMELIAGLGKTVLSVFHDLNLASHFCDYIYVLKEGKIAEQGVPEEIFTPEILAEVFRINAEIVHLENGKPNIVFCGSI